VPKTLPLVAVTVNGPAGGRSAVNRPVLLIDPPPLTFHVNAGCGERALPDESFPRGELLRAAGATDTLPGVTGDAALCPGYRTGTIAMALMPLESVMVT